MFRGAGKLRWPGVAFCEAGTASPPRHARTPQHVYKAYPPAIHGSHQSRARDAWRRSSHAAAAFKLCGSLQGVFGNISVTAAAGTLIPCL
ncbi:hypothetical protein COCMIDRAFT_33516 [Bipolaris oryzae ATCC 44560]|uniref:Uncharacterized protein n=1 Tax=Bipolaris oryzae ATCC 44560 TaxID=930090 RepID=W6ZNG1_COCMI|nr:uncharacterized protein COCMIDRAFT_33516 [Bipolaris oryzae ATCC 44560]EUC49044.1 hypothetical protein COCMIDRAFT_33516 [Bipolaris oryzae ATCC 44560]